MSTASHKATVRRYLRKQSIRDTWMFLTKLWPQIALFIGLRLRSRCAAAGLQGILPHDLRRSAVRNFIRAGVKETVAMRLSGHRTRSVFDRYNIVSEDDLIDASMKLQQFLVEAIKDEKVVPMQK